MQRHSGDHAAEHVLSREGERDRGDAGNGEEPFQLILRVITDAQDEEESDQKNDQRHQFAQKFWNRGLASLFEIEIPEIAIDQCDHHSGAEQSESGADMISPADIDSVNPKRGIEGEGEREELKENSEAHTGAPFKQTPEREGKEKGDDKNRRRRESALRFTEAEHR